jgi:hypothetical protein
MATATKSVPILMGGSIVLFDTDFIPFAFANSSAAFVGLLPFVADSA